MTVPYTPPPCAEAGCGLPAITRRWHEFEVGVMYPVCAAHARPPYVTQWEMYHRVFPVAGDAS